MPFGNLTREEKLQLIRLLQEKIRRREQNPPQLQEAQWEYRGIPRTATFTGTDPYATFAPSPYGAFVGGLGNALTMGTLGGRYSTPEAQAIIQRGREESPIAAFAGEMVGAGLPIAGMSSLVARGVPQLATKGVSLLSRMARAAAREGLTGGAYSTLSQLAESGKVEPSQLALESGIWSGLGTLAAPFGRLLETRAAKKQLQQQAAAFLSMLEGQPKQLLPGKTFTMADFPKATPEVMEQMLLRGMRRPELPAGAETKQLVDRLGLKAGEGFIMGEKPFMSPQMQNEEMARAFMDIVGPMEFHAGVDPRKEFFRAVQRLREAATHPEGRRFVNPAGTPEVTLAGRNIVEPFIAARQAMKSQMEKIGELLEPAFKGIKRGSGEDRALFRILNDPNSLLTPEQKQIRTLLDDIWCQVNKAHLGRVDFNKQGVVTLNRMLDEGVAPVTIWNFVKANKKNIDKAVLASFVPYRKGYVTHLIDYAKKTSELFRDVPLPKSIKFKFMKRLPGERQYRESAIDAVQAYVNAAMRDIHIGEALHKAIPNINKLKRWAGPILTRTEDGKLIYNFRQAPWFTERGYAEAFVRRQLGWPTRTQELVSLAFHISPRTQEKVAQGISALFYRALIGAALDTSIKNLTQGVNTFADLGLAPTLRGYRKLFTKAGRQELKAVNLLEDFRPLLMGGEDISLGKGAADWIDKNMLSGPMRAAEWVNRGAAYHAYLDAALKRGVPMDVAKQQALEGVRKVQFAYGREHISPYMQGWARPFMYQFFSFPTKQAELMYRMLKEGGTQQSKLMRYFLATGVFVVGGEYLGLDVGSIFFNPIKAVDPESSKGIELPLSGGKRITLSLSKLATSGPIPQSPFTPVIKQPYTLGKEIAEGERAWPDLTKRGVTSFMPGGRYLWKGGEAAYYGLTGEPVRDERGRVIYEPTGADAFARLTGLWPTKLEAERDRMRMVKEIEDEYYDYRTDIISALLDKDTTKVKQLVAEVRGKYPFLLSRLNKSIDYRTLIEEKRKRGQTRQERFYDSSLRQLISQALRGGQP